MAYILWTQTLQQIDELQHVAVQAQANR